jgi:MFS family permease
MTNSGFGKSYENKLILLFFMTWGFLFIDRVAISFIMPAIQTDLNITNTQVGIINMAFTIAWGVSTIIFGGISDKTGNLKRWVVFSGFLTAVFGAACALASSFTMLIVLRVLVGIAAGPFPAFMMTLIGKSVSKGRLGMAIGLVNTGVSVIAITLGPVLLTQFVTVTSWQMSLLVAALPGLILMFIVMFFVKPLAVETKEAAPVQGTAPAEKPKGKNMFLELFAYRNFSLCLIMAATHMAGYYVMQIFAALYWTRVAGLSMQMMGTLTAGMGFVGIVTSILMPKLSDIYGRKPILLISYIVCILPSLFMFLMPGSTISMVFYVLFAGLPGALGIFWMNVIPIETLPPHLTTTGVSLPMSMGEFVGGALITTIAGGIGDLYGLPTMMIIVSIGFLLSFFVSLPLIETSPRALERRAQKNKV